MLFSSKAGGTNRSSESREDALCPRKQESTCALQASGKIWGWGTKTCVQPCGENETGEMSKDSNIICDKVTWRYSNLQSRLAVIKPQV